MDWYQVLAIMFGNLAWILPLFIWARSESNSDRRDLLNTLNAMHKENNKEQKDFHGRLCALEEKYIQMMERFMEKR